MKSGARNKSPVVRNGNWGKRGKKKFRFTYDDIGRFLGVSPRTAKEYASRKLFDPNNFESIFEYAVLSERQSVVRMANLLFSRLQKKLEEST